MMRVACIFALVCSVGIGPVLAVNDTNLDDAAKKTGQGFGNLLKGMGQELKKVGGSLTSSDKKDDEKENKTKDDKAEANSENAK